MPQACWVKTLADFGQLYLRLFKLMPACAVQHDFFWKEEPLMCSPEQLPKYEASHEMQMKQDKRARNNAAAHPTGAHPCCDPSLAVDGLVIALPHTQRH